MGENGEHRDDADAGLWRGRSVARRFVSPDGFVVLVGRGAAENDLLTIKLASPKDFWLHVAAGSGSHVVVRNPDGVDALPRETGAGSALNATVLVYGRTIPPGAPRSCRAYGRC